MSLHHYVPKFHQKLFRPNRREGLVWAYDKRSSRLRLASIRTTMATEEYYAIPNPDGAGDETVEAMLSGIEDGGARVIKRLLTLQDGVHAFPDDWRAALAMYLGTLYLRGPSQRSGADALATFTARTMLDMALARGEWVEEALEAGISDSREELEAAKREWEEGRFVVEAPTAWSIQNISVGLQGVTPILLSRRWHLFRTVGQPHLVMGDQPVVIPRPAAGLRGVGPATPGAEITCPLDPTHLLVVEDAPADGLVHVRTLPHPNGQYVGATWVQIANDASWRFARHTVIAQSQADLVFTMLGIEPEQRNSYPRTRIRGLPDRWRRLLPDDMIAEDWGVPE